MISFREMKPEDADAVEAVEKASFSVPWSRKSFWEEAANERTYYLLALDGDAVLRQRACRQKGANQYCCKFSHGVSRLLT